jgi:putative flippase GtrA
MNEAFRVLRFGIVGGSSAAAYAVTLMTFVNLLGMGTIVSSAMAYVVSIPISFLGQKYFTFRSRGAMGRELPTYLLFQSINLAASVLVTYVIVDVLGMNHYVGIVAVISIVTLISYAAMALAVFRK